LTAILVAALCCSAPASAQMRMLGDYSINFKMPRPKLNLPATCNVTFPSGYNPGRPKVEKMMLDALAFCVKQDGGRHDIQTVADDEDTTLDFGPDATRWFVYSAKTGRIARETNRQFFNDLAPLRHR
jgi:hypothetical protein